MAPRQGRVVAGLMTGAVGLGAGLAAAFDGMTFGHNARIVAGWLLVVVVLAWGRVARSID